MRIRSNPFGFRIHSPFVYFLVSGVLFGRPFPKRVALTKDLKRREKKLINKIDRLTSFFTPETVWWPEDGTPLMNSLSSLFSQYFSGSRVDSVNTPGLTGWRIADAHSENESAPAHTSGERGGSYSIFSQGVLRFPGSGRRSRGPQSVPPRYPCRKMIIGSRPHHFPEELSGVEHPECWLLINLKDLALKDFFNTLRSSKETNITIEVNSTGIVIFNPKFMKQDYFVREWFWI